MSAGTRALARAAGFSTGYLLVTLLERLVTAVDAAELAAAELTAAADVDPEAVAAVAEDQADEDDRRPLCLCPRCTTEPTLLWGSRW